MSERFTADLRGAAGLAHELARGLGDGYLGTEHLLLGLRALDRGVAADVLRERGIGLSDLRSALLRAGGDDLDAAGLAAIGIDLDRVRQAAEAQLGPGALAPRRHRARRGHLPLTRRAKVVLTAAADQARALGDTSLDTGHLLLAITESHGLGADLLTDLGIPRTALAADLRSRLAERSA